MIDTWKFSSFSLLVRIHNCVNRFIINVKRNLNRHKMKDHVLLDNENLHSNTADEIIQIPELFEYLDSTEKQTRKLS